MMNMMETNKEEEEKLKQDIAERIIALPLVEKARVRDILKEIKRMKEEGKTEIDMEVFIQVVELEGLLH